MEYTTLGATGTRVSELCFGTWRFAKRSDGTVETDKETAHELLDACLDRGINFVDTANVYGDPDGTCESWIGEWLAERDREEVVLASKVYFPFDGWGEPGPNGRGLGRKHIRRQIEGSLERLGTDYLDCYYVHRWDEATPVEETLSVLTDLVREGKVNHLGASSMAAWQLTKALWTSDVEGLERFDVTQPRYNPAYREPVSEYLSVCADQELAVCPYSPLEGGFLTGKYDRDEGSPEGSRGDRYGWDGKFSEEQWGVLEAVESVAEEEGGTPAQVTLRWMADRERFTCVPIVGARSVEQLEENAGMVDISLSREQDERIAAAGGGEV